MTGAFPQRSCQDHAAHGAHLWGSTSAFTAVRCPGVPFNPPRISAPTGDAVTRTVEQERDSLARRLAVRFAELTQARAEAETLTDQLGDLRASLAAAEAEVDRIRAIVDAAVVWRRMRAGVPTRPKPEAAALIAAVDALMAGDVR
jgi:multidrug resistance efflux pump